MRAFCREFCRQFEEGDMRLSCIFLGIGLLLWGIIGLTMHPEEVVRAANRFALGDSAYWWAFNYCGVGLWYIYVAVKDFPHPSSLFLGAYSAMVWTMVAIARPSSTFTSGVSLNMIVVGCGILLIYRSGKGKR